MIYSLHLLDFQFLEKLRPLLISWSPRAKLQKKARSFKSYLEESYQEEVSNLISYMEEYNQEEVSNVEKIFCTKNVNFK